MNNFREDQVKTFSNLVDIMCAPFTQFIDEDREELDTAVEQLMSDIETLQDSMEEYKESVKLNTKFYL